MVVDFQRSILNKVDEIDRQVRILRSLIEQNRGTVENFDGFLLGDVSDYLDDFETQRTKMTKRFEADKKYWTNYAENIGKKRKEQNKELANLL